MSAERRKHPRIDVFAGNAEITRVIGQGKKPGDRARIVNWSRGGMLLRVPSPRRRFLFFSRPQVIHTQDAIACTLRLPPAYKSIEVMGEIVRAERVASEPDVLELALRFSDTTLAGGQIEELAALLEPKHLTSWSQRLPKAKSGRAARQSGQVAAQAPAGEAARKSQKLPASGSGKLTSAKGRVVSQRVSKAASERVVKAASERVVKAASERVSRRSSQRAAAPDEAGSGSSRPSARGQRLSSQRLSAVPARTSQRAKQAPPVE